MIEILKINFKKFLESNLPLNSCFDESLKEEDLRIVKEVNDEEKEFYDIECYCRRIGQETKWESIIERPTFVSGSKTRTEHSRIHHKIKNLIIE